jgi:hypothetical protein
VSEPVVQIELCWPALVEMTRAQKAAALIQVQRDRAIEAAWEAALVLSLAEDTPATLDPPAGTPGARSGSWAPEG